MTVPQAGVADRVIYETVRTPTDYARAYNDLMAQPTNRLRIRAVADVVRRIDGPVSRVVDIASGGGAYVDAVRRALNGEPRFFPADRQYACVGGYRLNHEGAPGTLADVTALPFLPASFDLALCLDIIEHLDDDLRFLRDVAALVRPGGWVVVSTHNAASLQHGIGLITSALQGREWRGWDPTHIRFYTALSLRRKLEAAGLEPVAFTGTYYVPFHLPARLASWPFERAGLGRLGRAVYGVVQAPGYAVNYVFECLSTVPVLSWLGWGIVVLARRPFPAE